MNMRRCEKLKSFNLLHNIRLPTLSPGPIRMSGSTFKKTLSTTAISHLIFDKLVDHVHGESKYHYDVHIL